MSENVSSFVPQSRPRFPRLKPALTALGACVVIVYIGVSAAYLGRNYDWGVELPLVPGFDESRLEAFADAGILELCCDHSAAVVDDPDTLGSPVLRVELRSDDPDVRGSKRAELRLKAAPFGEDHWYSARLRIPAGWQPSSDLVTVLQWHAVDDRFLGEAGRPPPLRLIVHENMWKVANHWDERLLTGLPLLGGDPSGGALLWQGPVATREWTDWVVHARWAHDASGLLEIWKDGDLIVRRSGPNTYNDILGPFYKAGIYIPGWKEEGSPQGARRALLIGGLQESRAPLLEVD